MTDLDQRAARLLAAIEERATRFIVPLDILRQDLIEKSAARIAAFTNPEHARVIATSITDSAISADATHIVEDRAAVLRRCQADRKIVKQYTDALAVWDLYRERRDNNPGDAQAEASFVRAGDEVVLIQRVILALAEGYGIFDWATSIVDTNGTPDSV